MKKLVLPLDEFNTCDHCPCANHEWNLCNVTEAQIELGEKLSRPVGCPIFQEDHLYVTKGHHEEVVAGLLDKISKLEQLARTLDAKLTESEAIIFHNHPVTT